MKFSLSLTEISKIVGGRLESTEENKKISGIATLPEAGDSDLSFLSNEKYRQYLLTTRAGAVLIGENDKLPPGSAVKNIIYCSNARLALAKLLGYLDEANKETRAGIHPTAVIGKNVQIESETFVGALSVIEDNVQIGQRTIIYPRVYIGHNSVIGDNCVIYPGVTIYPETTIGRQVIIHAGAVIGADGFGFETVAGRHQKVPQIGSVEIGDEVEIGANVCIDRATFGKTKIGRGTKIDDLVMVAHNVVVGENCLLVAQTGIAGSSRLGNQVTAAGQSGVAGHISVGNNVTITARAGVIKDVKDGEIVSGFPHRPHRLFLKIQAILDKLPELVEKWKR